MAQRHWKRILGSWLGIPEEFDPFRAGSRNRKQLARALLSDRCEGAATSPSGWADCTERKARRRVTKIDVSSPPSMNDPLLHEIFTDEKDSSCCPDLQIKMIVRFNVYQRAAQVLSVSFLQRGVKQVVEIDLTDVASRSTMSNFLSQKNVNLVHFSTNFVMAGYFYIFLVTQVPGLNRPIPI
jgi:hypothetical protein